MSEGFYYACIKGTHHGGCHSAPFGAVFCDGPDGDCGGFDLSVGPGSACVRKPARGAVSEFSAICGNPQDAFGGLERLYSSHLGDGFALWQFGRRPVAEFVGRGEGEVARGTLHRVVWQRNGWRTSRARRGRPRLSARADKVGSNCPPRGANRWRSKFGRRDSHGDEWLENGSKFKVSANGANVDYTESSLANRRKGLRGRELKRC